MVSSIQKMVVVVLLLAAMADLSFGQRTDATFAGIVTDSSGAVLPGAEIQLVNEGTAAATQQLTGETGEFLFNFVPAGTYTLKIVMAGFKGYESRSIPLGAAQNVRRTYVLEVGAITDNVTVTGEAPMVNTLSPEQRFNLESLEVKNLPMINRNITNILDIGGGITRGEGQTNVGFGGTRFRLNGLGGSAMSVTANGTDANGNAGSMTLSGYGGYNKISIMSAEAVAEVQVVKGVMPAEYGGAMAGNLSLITKSGTNEWHGSLFHRYEGSVFSARQPFLPHEPNSVWNQFGGSLGGPIKSDKAFFFVAYEGYRQSTSIAISPTVLVPTPRFRDILSTALPFPETKIMLSYFPLPNQPHAEDALTSTWIGPGPKTATDDHVDAKIDYMVGGGNFSFTFYGGHPYQAVANSNPLNPQYTEAFVKRTSVNYVLGRGGWTSSTRFGSNQNYFERIDKIWRNIDPNKPETTPGYRRQPSIVFPGLARSGETFNQQIRIQGPVPSYSIEQQFSIFRGKHSWKFGGLFSLPRGGRPGPSALYIPYQTLDDILRNEPSSYPTGGGALPFTYSMKNFGFFVQDDWRVNQKLVLNLGLRWDLYGPYIAHEWKGSLDKILEEFQMRPEALKALEGNMPMAVNNLDGLLDPVNFLWGPLRDPLSPYERDNVNLGPRFGFAYTLDRTGDFVLRGGFGVNFQGFTILGSAQRPPWTTRGAFTRAEAAARGLRFPGYAEDVFDIIVAENPTRKPYVTGRIDPNLKPPYAMNFTLGFQRALTSFLVLETNYVGTRGVKFDLSRPFNQVNRTTGLRPNPNDVSGNYRDNSQQTSYNSWQSSLKSRVTRGLLFNIHHTWGKTLSYAGGDIAEGSIGETRGNSIQDFDAVKIERSLSTGDVNHNFVLDFVYQAPTPFADSLVGRQVLGGWQVAGVWRSLTGAAIGANEGISQTGGRPDLLDIKGAVNKACCGFGNLQYLNTSVFQLVPVSRASSRTIRRGTSGIAPVRGPGSWNIDLSIGKNFPMGEGKTLEFKADMQNAFNHTQYTAVSTNAESPDFGQIFGTASARVVQLQLRLAF